VSPEKAEPFLTKFFDFKEGSSLYAKETGILAAIWKNQNEIAKSKKLMIKGLKNIQELINATRAFSPSSEETKSYQIH